MRKLLLEVGKLLVTLAIIVEAIYLLFTTPKYWPGVTVLAAILYMWLRLVYHLFGKLKWTKDGFEITDDTNAHESSQIDEIKEKVDSRLQDKVDKLVQRMSKVEAKNKHLQGELNSINEKLIKLNKEMSRKTEIGIHKFTISELFQGFYFTNDLENFTKERQPIDLDGFHNAIQMAKKNGEAFKENNYYRLIVKKYSEALAYKTINNIKSVCDGQALKGLEKLLYKAAEYPYSKNTIISIRDDLSNNSNKTKLTYEFELLIRNLDKLY